MVSGLDIALVAVPFGIALLCTIFGNFITRGVVIHPIQGEEEGLTRKRIERRVTLIVWILAITVAIAALVLAHA